MLPYPHSRDENDAQMDHLRERREAGKELREEIERKELEKLLNTTPKETPMNKDQVLDLAERTSKKAAELSERPARSPNELVANLAASLALNELSKVFLDYFKEMK